MAEGAHNLHVLLIEVFIHIVAEINKSKPKAILEP